MYKSSDFNYLQNLYQRPSNDIVVVYGSRYCGLKELLKDFAGGREYFYYKAPAVDKSAQLRILIRELNNNTKGPKYINGDYEKILISYLNDSIAYSSKKIIIFDDFINLFKADSTFINMLINVIFEKSPSGSVLVILSSHDVKWIEKDMKASLKKSAYEFTGILKVGDIDFTDVIKMNPSLSIYECFLRYTVCGHNPELYKRAEEYGSLKSYISSEFLKPGINDAEDASDLLPKSMRSPELYNTLLYLIAEGFDSLNLIYSETGIERAKLSVYLKTLIDYGYIHKTSSSIGSDSKSRYEFNDPHVHFRYRFTFDNRSFIFMHGQDRSFKKYIESSFLSYLEIYYPLFCLYRIKNARYTFPDGDRIFADVIFTGNELYKDKNHIIDLILEKKDGNIYICSCNLMRPHMSFKLLDSIYQMAEDKNISYKGIILISATGFDQKISITSVVENNVQLINDKEMPTEIS